MPNIPQQQTIVQYLTNGTQTAFTFAFYAPLATDIQVYSQASTALPNPEADILVLGVDYTIAFNADPFTGGTINMTVPPPNGNYLTINRMVAASLNTNFAAAQNFNGANLDAALDRLLLLCQQNLNYNLERNLSYVINTYLPNAAPFTQLPELANMQIWMGTSSGVVAVLLEEGADTSVLRSQLALANSTADGASIVGYWDKINLVATTVHAQLDKLSEGGTDVVTDTGTANNILVAITNFPTPTLGSSIVVKVAATNLGTAATNITINSGSPIAVSIPNITSFLPAGALIQNNIYEFIFNGTNWTLKNPSQFCYGALMTLSGGVIILPGATSRFIFNVIDNDPNNICDVINFQMVPKIAGWYQINSNMQVTSTSTAGVGLIIFKNSNEVREICQTTIIANQIEGLVGSGRVFCNGTTDAVQMYVSNGGSNNVTSENECYFEMFYLGNS